MVISTFAEPVRKASITRSRSTPSKAPCNAATLCPSAVIRRSISEAVSRRWSRCEIRMLEEDWRGEEYLDKDD